MTNRTNTQLDTLATMLLERYYSNTITHRDSMLAYIDDAGMDSIPADDADALANAIAFDLDELTGGDDDLYYSPSETDALADRIAAQLIARF